jgi:hypothetical protein
VIHRLETNKLRNVACLFAHLLATDALPWSALTAITLTEEATTSSSRIFIKYLFQVGWVGVWGVGVRWGERCGGVGPRRRAAPRHRRTRVAAGGRPASGPRRRFSPDTVARPVRPSKRTMIFTPAALQELSATLGLVKLNQRLNDPAFSPWFGGIFPRDSLQHMRFSINFFTSIGARARTAPQLRRGGRCMPAPGSTPPR